MSKDKVERIESGSTFIISENDIPSSDDAYATGEEGLGGYKGSSGYSNPNGINGSSGLSKHSDEVKGSSGYSNPNGINGSSGLSNPSDELHLGHEDMAVNYEKINKLKNCLCNLMKIGPSEVYGKILIGYFIIVFIIVNMLQYDNGNFYFSINNLWNISFSINKLKFDLFISFLTIGSILITILKWMDDINIRDITDINGLLEEIHHNFNISGDTYYKNDKKIFFPKIYKIINEQKDITIYPNIDNKTLNEAFFEDCVEKSLNTADQKSMLFPLQNFFIAHAITSDNIFSRNHKLKRIFLNLGHLNFSILRFNSLINTFNLSYDKEFYFERLKTEYYTWVNFRLAFMLVDLIMNTKEKVFIDKSYVNEIKGYFKTTNIN